MNCFLDAVDTQHYRNICEKHATRRHCFDSRTLHYKKQFKKIVPQKLNAIVFFDIEFFKYFFRVLHEASSSWLKFCRSILGHPVYLVIYHFPGCMYLYPRKRTRKLNTLFIYNFFRKFFRIELLNMI
jgi:hypothetical protein